MFDYKCPECDKGLDYIDSIFIEHLTGDEKDFRLYNCNNCDSEFLIMSLEATIGPGVNYYKYRIDLSKKEANEIKNKMSQNKDDKKDASDFKEFFDNFEKKTSKRRVVLEDEIERWLTSEEIEKLQDDKTK